MDFIDQEDYDLPLDYEDLFFNSNIFNNPPTPDHSKSTEDLEQKIKDDRKQRILKKRIEKKQKVKTEVVQIMSKEEMRKLRNRNSAQLSRDKKKIIFDNLIQENKAYSNLLQQKDEQIELLQQENTNLRLRVQYLEEITQIIKPNTSQQYKCIHMVQQRSKYFQLLTQLSKKQLILTIQDDGVQIQRVNAETKSKMMNYGVISLLAIACIFSVMNNDYEFNPKPIALSQLSNQKYDFLASKQSQKNQTSLLSQESNFTIPTNTFQNQTLFYNCTGRDKECQNFVNIAKAENAENIYFGNDETYHTPADRIHNFEMGENVYLMKIKQGDEDNFIILRARCQITENNSLVLERNTYEEYNNNQQH